MQIISANGELDSGIRDYFLDLLEMDSICKENLAECRIAVTGSTPYSEEQIIRIVEIFNAPSLISGFDVNWRAAIEGRTGTAKSAFHDHHRLQGQFYFEDLTFLVVGRTSFDTDLLQYSLLVDDMEFMTQEDFISFLIMGEKPEYFEGDTRISNHPGLSYLASMGFEWPSTEASPSTDPSETLNPGWNMRSELRKRGYSVGEGVSIAQRQQALQRCVTDLGLKKVANHIAWLARQRKKRHDNTQTGAIRRWEEDLAWLKKTYYVRGGNRRWPWPTT